MRVLLVSTYEMGHQPVHLAAPAAALGNAGHEVTTVDLAVDRLDPALLDSVDVVAFSVPMHTAMRLAMRGAEAVRARRSDLPVCFYGLYATVSRDRTLGPLADRLIAGEYVSELVAWVDDLQRGARSSSATVNLDRAPARLPVRAGLPPLERYARLEVAGEQRLAGYVEASHGCSYRCRHCPVPAVYDGRTRKVPADVVLADVDRLVSMGARHITFGDPDFLNRWRHALEVVHGLHAAHPEVTYDITTKVEHVLRYQELWPEFAATGCLFAVSAFEILNDDILGYLEKGHTAAEAGRAVEILRSHGIEVRPSWLPFMPWTTVEDVHTILDFVVRHDLVSNVDPVQYTIRLLIPEGSLLLDLPEILPYLGPYDDERLTYTWRPADPRTGELQQELSALVERRTGEGVGLFDTFMDVREAVHRAAGIRGDLALVTGSREGRPRLTEPWFC